MKKCTTCKYAEWGRTISGRLHPSGRGKCGYPVRDLIKELPSAYYYLGAPTIFGGNINRHEELHEHCPYFEAASK